MPAPDLALLFVRPLNLLGVRYMVSGSFAAMLYGEPRLTHDVDIILHLRPADVPRLAPAFPAPDFYLPPAEVIALEMSRSQRGHFNVIHVETGFKADFYLCGRDALHLWALERTRPMTYQGEPVRVAPPEYVIVRKLEYFREGGSEKHLRDIQTMLAVSGERLDLALVQEWVQRLGLEHQWQQCQASPEPGQ
jgi:hypothetical protein